MLAKTSAALDPVTLPRGPAPVIRFPQRATPFTARLDRIAETIAEPGRSIAALQELVALLEEAGPEAAALLRAHRLHAMLLEDPLAAHALAKPRGYPGDAALIDLIYGLGDSAARVAAASPPGRAIHAAHSDTAHFVAARECRLLLAELVDRTAIRVRRAGVLSLGAGHLRESAATRHADTLDIWLALDQDAESIAEVRRANAGRRRVAAEVGRIERFIAQPQDHGLFDLVYAAGLYDYLDAATARRLTQAAFSALRPGGELRFANYARGLAEATYMAACMDWPLVYRDEAEMQALLDSLPRAELAGTVLYRGANGAMIYAGARRRG